MKTIKIFLASSNKLVDERKEFEIFINRRNNRLLEKKMFLKLVIWEDLLASLSKTRSQDVYNEALRDCDIFILLFHTKVGEYSEEEFDAALKQFEATDKPRIFTYLKTAKTDEPIEDSLNRFKERLHKMEHFYTTYERISELTSHFRDQFEDLESEGFFSGSAKTIIAKIKGEITKGQAISKILEKYRDDILSLSDDIDMELTLLQARSTKLEKDSRIGIISSGDAGIERAKIINAFLSLLDDIESD